ncbi:hypothetical protein H0G86_005305 [Trichoderma simmonsii]|uniref:Uncharacterized protein n=1 Tax=Trichoderma simmonsii TaxID=1491479 RepID=A0A8G0LC76_9HYPO|nr:hypothetical protein H0G86_005305 [Trichoderma simmonsii]
MHVQATSTTRMWRALCFSMTLFEAYSKSQFVHELPVVQVHRAEQGNAEQLNACQRRAARDATRLTRPWTLGVTKTRLKKRKKQVLPFPESIVAQKSVCPMKHCAALHSKRCQALPWRAVGGPIRRHVQPRFLLQLLGDDVAF